MESKYDTYESGSSGGYDNVELRFSLRATVHGVFDRVFGTESQYGQSLGVNMRDVRLDDGCIYYYPSKDRYKIFSWKDVKGLSPVEMYQRDDQDDPHVDLADTIHTDAYSDGNYELVAARVPELVDDGETVVEASSKTRDVTGMDGDAPTFSEWEDLGGERVPFHDTITWHNGSDEYGPTASAKSLLETLTIYGSDAVVDEDDIFNWLPDTSGEDLLRDDLKDRQVEFFIVEKPSQSGYTYNDPIIEDLSTGTRIGPNNRGGDSGNAGTEASSAEQEAKAADDADRSYPEPIADFIQSGRNLNMNRDRANKLLDDLIAGSNPLTQEMVTDNGGRDEIIEQVV